VPTRSISWPTTVSTRRRQYFAAADDSDAAYFALAVARECSLDAGSDEFIISGDRRRRAAVSETLRRFATAVVPLIVPASATATCRAVPTFRSN